MERRIYPRVPLDNPCLALLRLDGGRVLPVMVVDVNRGGVQVVFGSPQGVTGDLLGLPVSVLGLPARLDPAGEGCEGSVSWVAPLRCGVRFARLLSVSDDEIASLNASL